MLRRRPITLAVSRFCQITQARNFGNVIPFCGESRIDAGFRCLPDRGFISQTNFSPQFAAIFTRTRNPLDKYARTYARRTVRYILLK